MDRSPIAESSRKNRLRKGPSAQPRGHLQKDHKGPRDAGGWGERRCLLPLPAPGPCVALVVERSPPDVRDDAGAGRGRLLTDPCYRLRDDGSWLRIRALLAAHLPTTFPATTTGHAFSSTGVDHSTIGRRYGRFPRRPRPGIITRPRRRSQGYPWTFAPFARSFRPIPRRPASRAARPRVVAAQGFRLAGARAIEPGGIQGLGEDPVDSPEGIIGRVFLDVPARDQRHARGGDEASRVLRELRGRRGRGVAGRSGGSREGGPTPRVRRAPRPRRGGTVHLEAAGSRREPGEAAARPRRCLRPGGWRSALQRVGSRCPGWCSASPSDASVNSVAVAGLGRSYRRSFATRLRKGSSFHSMLRRARGQGEHQRVGPLAAIALRPRRPDRACSGEAARPGRASFKIRFASAKRDSHVFQEVLDVEAGIEVAGDHPGSQVVQAPGTSRAAAHALEHGRQVETRAL